MVMVMGMAMERDLQRPSLDMGMEDTMDNFMIHLSKSSERAHDTCVHILVMK